MKKILSPKELKKLFPLEREDRLFIQESRAIIQRILLREEKKKLLIVGPCSVHEETSIREYADRLQELSQKCKNFFFVLRFFIEKPRTSLGWTGFLNDPLLDGSCQIDVGLQLSRKMLTEMARKKIPCAMEFLHPLFAPYFSDLISWGVIGSRTSSSQIHRQLASCLPFAVGFKNSHWETIDITLHSLTAARASHVFPTIDEEGKIAICQSSGNPLPHIVLRGNYKGPNCSEKSVQDLLEKSQSLGCSLPIIVDCSHENSLKDLDKQKECFRHVINNQKCAGFMLESHLFPGRQGFPSKKPAYGVSLTDPCLGWEETEDLLLEADLAIAY